MQQDGSRKSSNDVARREFKMLAQKIPKKQRKAIMDNRYLRFDRGQSATRWRLFALIGAALMCGVFLISIFL